MNKTHWFFATAIVLQLVILAAIRGGRVYTLAAGTTIVLKTAPVDPFDILSGYHVVLSYEISNPAGIPGYYGARKGTAYVVLKEGEDGLWHAASASERCPSTVPPGAIVIKGHYDGWRAHYGIESYFVPEGKGPEIEQALRNNRNNTRIEVKVDSFGHAALVRLHVGDETYEY